MSSKQYPLVTLVERQQISARFCRYTFAGEDLASFPPDCEGGYVKLMFDSEQRPLQALPAGFPDIPRELKPIQRSFTIAEFAQDGANSRLSIDVVQNKAGGIAADWMSGANIQDRILLVGPGKKQVLPADYDWYFVVGDATALPAICVNLRKLPQANTKPVVCVLDIGEQDFPSMELPENVSLVFVRDSTQQLAVEVPLQPWLDGRCYIWAACEFDQMRSLRRYFRIQRKVNKQDMYISSYWKRGDTDEGNKRAKKLDAEADL